MKILSPFVSHVRQKKVYTFGILSILAVSIFFSYTISVNGFGQQIPDHLRLKASKSHILGAKKYGNGVVKYAYNSGRRPSSNPSNKVIEEAQRNGIQVAGEDVSQRTKHARVFATGRPNQFVAEIISGKPQFYQDARGIWWEADYATTTEEAFDEQTQDNIVSRLFSPKVAFAVSTTSTFYPDADTESTSVDGVTNRTGPNTYSTAHDASDSTNAYDSDAADWLAMQGHDSTPNYYLQRAFFLFNTSAITGDAVVNSATFSIYSDGITNNDDGDSISLVSSNPASNTSISNADYDQLGTTKFSDDIAISSFASSGYKDYVLNTSGLDAIALTGVTKFGLRTAQDISSTAPTGHNDTHGRYSDYSGTDYDPKLVVVYTLNPTLPSIPTLKNRKPADEAWSNSTLHTDDTLQLGLEANKTYEIRGTFFASSTSATPDLKFRFGGMVGAEVDIGYNADNVNGRLAANSGTTTVSDTIPLTSTPVAVQFFGTVKTSATAGVLRLQWAQSNNNPGNATRVGRGSYIYAQEF